MAKSKAVIIFCVDPRIAEAHMKAFVELCKNELDGEMADPIFSAGSISSLLTEDGFGIGVLNNVSAAVGLHDIDTIVVVEHENCGYYGIKSDEDVETFALDEANEKSVHARNARVAVESLQLVHPQIKNAVYKYMRLDGTLEEL